MREAVMTAVLIAVAVAVAVGMRAGVRADTRDGQEPVLTATDRSTWEHLNHFELLGVAKDVAARDLQKRYRVMALKYHPDKCGAAGAGADPKCREMSEQLFVKIVAAYECVKDPVCREKRGPPDPVDTGPCGCPLTDYACVKKCSDDEIWWLDFQIYVSVAFLAMCIAAPAAVINRRKLKALYYRVTGTRAAVSSAAVAAGLTAKTTAEREAERAREQELRAERDRKQHERDAKRAEDDAQRRAEEAAQRAASKAAKAAADAAAAAERKQRKALRERFEGLCDRFDASARSNGVTWFAAADAYAIATLLPDTEFAAFCASLIGDDQTAEAVVANPLLLEQAVYTARCVDKFQSHLKRVRAKREDAERDKAAAERAASAKALWSAEDLSLLAKAMAKYPGGAAKRWEQIAKMCGRTEREVIVAAKTLDLRKMQSLSKPNAQLPASMLPGAAAGAAGDATDAPAAAAGDAAAEAKATDAKDVKSAPAPAAAVAVEAGDWSDAQQKQLEGALRKHPKTEGDSRWDLIGAAVTGKTKEQCIARYKQIIQQIAKAKAKANAK